MAQSQSLLCLFYIYPEAHTHTNKNKFVTQYTSKGYWGCTLQHSTARSDQNLPGFGHPDELQLSYPCPFPAGIPLSLHWQWLLPLREQLASWFILLLFNVQRWGFLLPVIQTVLWAQNYSFPYVFSMVLMTAVSECLTRSISFSNNFERMLTLYYQWGKKAGGDELQKGSS